MDQIVAQVIYIHHSGIVIIGPLLVTTAAEITVLMIGCVLSSGLLEV